MIPLILLATIPAGQTFECVPVVINDGDTFRCSNGVKVRLRAIDSPEMPNHPCRRNRHCAPGDPFASKAALTRLAYRQTLRCVADGRTWERVAAWCSLGGVDLSCSQWRGGWAIHWTAYDKRNMLCRR